MLAIAALDELGQIFSCLDKGQRVSTVNREKAKAYRRGADVVRKNSDFRRRKTALLAAQRGVITVLQATNPPQPAIDLIRARETEVIGTDQLDLQSRLFSIPGLEAIAKTIRIADCYWVSENLTAKV